MALDVGDRLLSDPPELSLLHERQPTCLFGSQLDDQAAALPDPFEEGRQRAGEALGLADLGAQVVEGVPHLADHTPYVCAQAVERLGRVGPGRADLHDAVELKGQVGQRLPDAVV